MILDSVSVTAARESSKSFIADICRAPADVSDLWMFIYSLLIERLKVTVFLTVMFFSETLIMNLRFQI